MMKLKSSMVGIDEIFESVLQLRLEEAHNQVRLKI